MKGYPTLLSPIKIGNRILKSRFLYPCALPHFLQGSENYPGEPIRHFYTQIARNGAAVIFWHDLSNHFQRQQSGDAGHFANYDPDDKGAQNYLCQFAEQIHYYNTLLTTDILVDVKMGYTVSGGETHYARNAGATADTEGLQGNTDPSPESEEGFPPMVFAQKTMFTGQDIEEMIQESIDKALMYKSFGWDAVSFDISRGHLGEFRQASINHRTDQYGGSFENRIRFPLEYIRRVRQAIGRDMLIIVNTAGIGATDDSGQSWEDNPEEYLEFLRRITPYVDLLHLRGDIFSEAPDYYNPPDLQCADRIKAAGITIPICSRTGFQTPDLMEKAVASGRVEMMSSAHMFITNGPNLGQLLQEGRNDDVVPCIACGVCQGISRTGMWTSRCSVNPELGIGYRLDKLTTPTGRKQNVAVVGGGPVGMYAAVEAKKRGHDVTLFEAAGELGGQLLQAEKQDLGKHLDRYLDFLKYQLKKQGVTVELNTRATADTIRPFDVTIIAIGAHPTLPDIPGAETAVDFNSVNVYGNEDRVGQNVVVIGGSTGMAEAGAHLYRQGRTVTVITRNRSLGHDLQGAHTNHALHAAVSEGFGPMGRYKDGFTVIEQASTTRLDPGKVTYLDKQGELREIVCDTIIANGGMQVEYNEICDLANASNRYFLVGDANSHHNLFQGIRDAFAAVNQL